MELYLLFGDSIDEIEEPDKQAEGCYIREPYDGTGNYISRLLFPAAFKGFSESLSARGVPFDAKEAMSMFVLKGIDILKSKYRSLNDVTNTPNLKDWMCFLKNMEIQQRKLGRECNVFATW